MSDNKFIKRLKGEQTAKSVLEIKNESAKTSFANMPQGTSNAIDVFLDHRGNATAVLNGTTNWKVSNSELLLADTVSGDGQDFTSTYSVSGAGLWVNASYTFPSTGDPNHPVAMVFNPNTKWVLKLCGDSLIVDGGNVLDFTLIVKIGSAHIFSKNFKVAEHAGQFSTELILDFGETNAGIIKAGGLAKLTLQLLCGTDNASARIYNGMTVLTCLQRKVDASAVSNSSANVEDVLDGNIIPSDYFSNPEFIDQVEDGADAYAIFTRDGDDVNLSGWTPKEEIARKEEIIVKSSTIPTASADLVGSVYQYVGETDSSYTHGYIYECKTIPADTLVFSPDTVSCSWTDLSSFLQAQTEDYNSVVSGTMTYFENAELWRLVFTDENGDTVLTYQQYTADWEDVGFTFNDIFHDGDIVSFTRYTDSTQIWERIDVQPNHNEDIAELQADVTEIQSVIPAEASASNQLADKNYVQSGLNGKQATISDLAAIRSGAALGATAVQPSDLATVATTGSYNDLTDTPVIPSMSNRVNGAPLSNLASVFYGTSSTAAATVQKVVSIPSITTLDVGTIIVVQPTATSTVANSTIKLNDFPAYPMRYNNTAITTSTDSIVWNAAYPSVWVFDGTYWCFVAHGIDSNTTYSTMSVAEGTTGTATSNRVLQAVNLKQIIQGTTLTDIDVATTGAVSASDTITDGIGKLQATKADKSELPTVGNGTITITQGGITKGTFTTNQGGDTTIALDAGGGGIGNIDNLTITANADDEIQAVAVIDQNTGIAKTWTGTMAEYDAIVTKDPETEYIITDDIGGSATEIGEITETLNQKADLNLSNTASNIDFVIESQEPTSANNYTWYRKYKSGWVEQGGRIPGNIGGTYNVSMPVEMADTNYNFIGTGYKDSNDNGFVAACIDTSNMSTTGFRVYTRYAINGATGSPSQGGQWQVSGMAA